MWPVLAERGDLDGAERMCQHNLEISKRYGLRTAQPAETMLVLHEAMRGRIDSAAAQAERLQGSVFAGGAALYLEIFRGDPERALAAIAPSAAVFDHAPDGRAAPAHGLHALLAAVIHDDPGPARLVSEAGIGAWYNRAFVSLAEAVVAGAPGERVAADAAAADAFRDFGPFPSMSAVATALAAQRAIRDGWGSPAAWLGAAREHFEFLGNKAMSRRCDALLRAGGFPVPRRGRGDAEVPARLRRLGITSREMDVLLLVFLASLAVLYPVSEIHAQLILLSIGFFQVFERKFIDWAGSRGDIYSTLIKIGLASLLIWHTGGIQSSYYLMYYLPVVTAAIYSGPWGTLGWTTLCSAAYCSFLIPALHEYRLTASGAEELGIRVLFFFLAAILVNRFVMENREQAERYRLLAEQL